MAGAAGVLWVVACHVDRRLGRAHKWPVVTSPGRSSPASVHHPRAEQTGLFTGCLGERGRLGERKRQMKAVRFDEYGGSDALHVSEVERPVPRAGEVQVQVVTASINPGEIAIREGAMADRAPSTFPSGQGSDLAGRVAAMGDGVTQWSVGDEVLGWTDERAAQAEYVVVPSDQLTAKPAGLSWEQAGALYVAGGTAQGMIASVGVRSGETVLVTGAAGGVGSILVQLLRHLGARVLGVAGPDNDEWLVSVGVEPINYGDDLAARIGLAAPDGIDAALDAHGGGYVDLAVDLGVEKDRILTIIDFAGAERLGVRTVFGYQVTTAGSLADLADLAASGALAVPIAATYPLADVREAYDCLAERHTRGKIVLRVAD